MSQKSLYQIINEHIDSIIDGLGLNCDPKPSSYFIVMNDFKSLLDVASKEFDLPSVTTYKSISNHNEDVFYSLELMGFVKKDGSFYGLTSVGVDLMNAYLKQTNPNFKTRDELSNDFYSLSDHLD